MRSADNSMKKAEAKSYSRNTGQVNLLSYEAHQTILKSPSHSLNII